MFGIGFPELVVLTVIGVVFVLPFWKIFTKAGFPGWWSIFMITPLTGVIALYYLAFVEWPIHRELNKKKELLR